MGLLDFLRSTDINRGIKEFMETKGAVLLDVRTPGEYREGHIPGSRNLPLQALGQAESIVKNKTTPLFVHCLSGSRSRQAAILQQMGYSIVKHIGGISAYRGKVER